MTTVKTIMIVDDEKDVITVLEKRFQREGFNVLTAKDGNAAISMARRKHPDLVILDVGLPDMHGGELAQQIKLDPDMKHVPMMFVSALYSRQEQMEHPHRFGGDRLFSKPYDIEEVMNAVHELIG